MVVTWWRLSGGFVCNSFPRSAATRLAAANADGASLPAPHALGVWLLPSVDKNTIVTAVSHHRAFVV